MDYRRTNTNQLYVMESSEYIKIGVSSDSVKRLSKLNQHLEDSRKFRLVKVKVCRDRHEALKLEGYMHSTFKESQMLTDIIGAKTECFSKSILPEVLECLDTLCEFYSFDPYIVVSILDVPKILGTDLRSLYKLVGVDPRFKKKYDLALRNLAANVVMAKGRKIFYRQRIVKMLGLSGDTAYKVFSRLWEPFTALPTNSYDYKVKMVNPYLYPPRVLDFSLISLGYVSTIESLYDRELHTSVGLRKAVNFILSCIYDLD